MAVRYSMPWVPVSTKSLKEAHPADYEADKIEVVSGEWGNSAQLSFYEEGQVGFYPLSRDCTVPMPVGKILNRDYCFIVTLKRGNATTEKLLYKPQGEEE